MHSADVGGFEKELALVAATGNCAGTWLEKQRARGSNWLKTHRTTILDLRNDWIGKLRRDGTLRRDFDEIASRFRGDLVYRLARPLVETICAGELKWGKRRITAEIDRAVQTPGEYPTAWGWSILIILHDVVLNVPKERRRQLDPDLGLLERNRNDFVDAAIVASGARCGNLLTDDGGLYERCRILYERDLIGIAPEWFTPPTGVQATSPAAFAAPTPR